MLKNLQKQIEEQMNIAKTNLEEEVKKLLPDFKVSANLNMDLTQVSVMISRDDKVSQRMIFSRIVKDKDIIKDISMTSYEINQENGLMLRVIPLNVSLQLLQVMFMIIDQFVESQTAEPK